MNGTSMASPHVCGAVSILISGLKHENLKWSPFSIKRALSATARPLPNLCPYGQGHGLLQVNDYTIAVLFGFSYLSVNFCTS